MFVVTGCGDTNTTAKAPDELTGKVVVSIPPLAGVVKPILAESAEVVVLLPAGRSPHGFSPTADQMALLSEADAIITIGLGLDPWADRAVDASGNTAINRLVLGDMLDLAAEECTDHDHHHHGHGHHHHDHGHGHDHHTCGGPVDPHIWLDPVLMNDAAEKLGTAFAELYPEHGESIRSNTTDLQAKLTGFHVIAGSKLADLPNKKFITYHNAFDRFAERYGMEVIAHLAEVDVHGASATPAELAKATNMIRTHQLAVIYTEPQMPSSLVDGLAEQTGIEVLTIDPLGSENQDYFDLLNAIVDGLVKGQTRMVQTQAVQSQASQ